MKTRCRFVAFRASGFSFLFLSLSAVALFCEATCRGQESPQAVFKDLSYVPDGGERQRLDIYLPSDYKAREKKLPVLVWIHGGGWLNGDKANPPGAIATQIGYAVVSINYRFSNQAVFPAQIEDCKAAIRWLRANAAEYRLDGDRIGVWGASAGGHLAALLGTTADVKEFDVGAHLEHSSSVQAVCDIFGPTDFMIMVEQPKRFDKVQYPVVALLGGHLKEKAELATKASPIYYVKKGNAPFLILHGDQDKLVEVDQSIRFAKALKKADVEHELIITLGAGHDGTVITKKDLFPKIREFFDKHLQTP